MASRKSDQTIGIAFSTLFCHQIQRWYQQEERAMR
jgi:hypothetical protein